MLHENNFVAIERKRQSIDKFYFSVTPAKAGV
jgi:hypothetical protein